jgi:hypothetical protein
VIGGAGAPSDWWFSAQMIACLYEDRASSFVGVQLAVLSLAEFAPDLRVEVVCPPATADLEEWLARFPSVSLARDPVTERGWNVKPDLLLGRLRRGGRRCSGSTRT